MRLGQTVAIMMCVVVCVRVLLCCAGLWCWCIPPSGCCPAACTAGVLDCVLTGGAAVVPGRL